MQCFQNGPWCTSENVTIKSEPPLEIFVTQIKNLTQGGYGQVVIVGICGQTIGTHAYWVRLFKEMNKNQPTQ